jgi:diguanylate cyclase (GGDEF)-like protein/PAS domain S-box-containing protein
MAAEPQVRLQRTERKSARDGIRSRHRLVNILFVHRDERIVGRYLQELRIAEFSTHADTVVTHEQFTARLCAQSYDIVVAEYPGPDWKSTPVLDVLRQSGKQIPLIFVTDTIEREIRAELITNGAFDCIEMDHVGHIPVAIRRALDEGRLRIERDRAEKMLKHSEAKYRALIGNLTYGICRCGLDGNFLDVNQALINMLGYRSKEGLLATNLASSVILDSTTRTRLLGESDQKGQMDPLETEWKGNNGAAVTVRLTGRAVHAEQGVPESYEVIVEDVTKQRALEDQLRHQATRDPLTGLANYRQLVDVLNTEIKRSKRTGRIFALLLLDLDGLKQINDRFGHLVGSKALCRLADALCICSRDIDTAARYGGDEFALVLPETGAEAADVVARRVCDSLANDAKRPHLSVSVGIAIYLRDGKNVESLLRAADRALYKMKDARGAAHENLPRGRTAPSSGITHLPTDKTGPGTGHLEHELQERAVNILKSFQRVSRHPKQVLSVVATPSGAPAPSEPASLEDILITEKLKSRRYRRLSSREGTLTLHTIARTMAASPDELMDRLLQLALELCGAGTAGLSLLETNLEGEQLLRWTNLAGILRKNLGDSTPRSFSPCGVTLDCNAPQLFAYPARHFQYFNSLDFTIVEALVVPVYVGDQAPGTIWIMSHDQEVKFDSEDVRTMTGLAEFACCGLRLTRSCEPHRAAC